MRRRPKTLRNRDHGFSFIEVIIALVVLGIINLTMINVLTVSMGALSRTRQTVLATEICREEVEIIRNMPFDAILALGTTFPNNKLSFLKDGQGILTLEPGAGADIRKLTVSVSWTYRGQPRRADVVTLITRQGVDKR